MSSTWGGSWLASWGVSWDGAELPPDPPPATSTSGGAVIVDLPKRKKRRKKGDAQAKDEISQAPKEITEDEAKGMAAIYGAQMLMPAQDIAPTESIAPEAPESAIQEEADVESILNSFPMPAEIPEITKETEPEIIEEEDDIALILAIIEAIG